jgi:hypothetical protein
MKTFSRKAVVQALRAATRIINAGLVAYPVKMYESIASKVDAQYAAWALMVIEKELEKAEKDLEVFKPKSTSKFPPLALSPAVMKMVRQQAPLLAENGTDEASGPRGRVSYEYKQVFKTEKLVPEFVAAMKRFEKLSKDDLADLTDIELKCLALVLDAAAGANRSEAAWKASRVALNYISDRKEFERKLGEAKTGATDFKQDTWDGPKVQEMVRRLDAMKKTKAWLESLGAKAATMKNKRKKRLSADEKVEWDEPINLAGLPAKYPIKLPPDYKTIHVEVLPARAKFAGAWGEQDRTLTIIVPGLSLHIGKNKDMMQELHETLQHELRHMVQYMMQNSLAQQQTEKGLPLKDNGPHRRAGTPLSPRTGKGALTPRDEALAKQYPEATKDQLYYLSPIEFFPQVGSAWRRFRQVAFMFKDEAEYTKDQLIDAWRNHVGVTGYQSRDLIDPFYAALRLHDKPLYKRALKEGAVILQDYLKERDEKSKADAAAPR